MEDYSGIELFQNGVFSKPIIDNFSGILIPDNNANFINPKHI